ncbi:MAG: PrgI family protein [Patescibacteria group bacterium]|nr:MAG: PrgI family protein [Patescibacteria group bacterium]
MQQFTVPQFIEVEDKIIGALTVRQFVISLVGVLLIALCYRLFDFELFLIVGILIFLITVLFAFIKVNAMPFHFFLLNLIETLKKPRLRIWQKDDTMLAELMISHPKPKTPPSPPDRQALISRLNELSLIVDTKGMYQGEVDDNIHIKDRRDF